MRFFLVYSGPLHATANKSKPVEVQKVRAHLSPQLELLWQTNHALQELKHQAWVKNPKHPSAMQYFGFGPDPTPFQLSQLDPGSMLPLHSGIHIKNNIYHPLVRKSLHLNCDLDILFLRQDDPTALVSQGGDLDGRVKCLIDALRVPSVHENDVAPSDSKEVYCLMESDTLVSSLSVNADRLLFPKTQAPNEVHLVIEVSIRVLRVKAYNTCLL